MRAAFEKGGTGYGDFKKQLFARLWEFFEPMRQRREEILAQPDYIDEVLAQAERANAIAERSDGARSRRGRDSLGGFLVDEATGRKLFRSPLPGE